MRILLVSRDQYDLQKIVAIRRCLLERLQDIEVVIVSGVLLNIEIPPNSGVVRVREGLIETHRRLESLSDGEIAQRLVEIRNLVPPNLYKADHRFQTGWVAERHLAIEQFHFSDRIEELIDTFRPDLVFMTAGATLVRNVVFLMAKAKGIRAYRMMPTNFLTPGRAGPRFWFCSNNENRLSDDELDQFDHDPKALCRHAETLIESIHSGEFRLAEFARTKRADRASLSLSRLLRDFISAAIGRDKFGAARRRLAAGINYRRNRRLATNPASLEQPYLLFPLNVPMDAQLTLRAPHYVDLLSVCQQILNVLPLGVQLILREHPGSPGMLDYHRLRSLLNGNPRVRFVTGDVELAALLDGACGLVTINSTSGLEAAIAGKPVLALGPAFYRNSGFVYDVNSPEELAPRIAELMADPLSESRGLAIRQTLNRLLNEAWPPPEELHGSDPESVDACLIEGIARRVEKLRCASTSAICSLGG